MIPKFRSNFGQFSTYPYHKVVLKLLFMMWGVISPTFLGLRTNIFLFSKIFCSESQPRDSYKPNSYYAKRKVCTPPGEGTWRKRCTQFWAWHLHEDPKRGYQKLKWIPLFFSILGYFHPFSTDLTHNRGYIFPFSHFSKSYILVTLLRKIMKWNHI